MTNSVFDVVCFGTDQQGEGREIAVKALAVILKMSPSEAAERLDRGGPILLRKGVSESDAKALQASLGQLGLRCNYKPSTRASHTLEILPHETTEDAGPATVCPECGAQVPAAETGRPPELCPRCGLVFEKHERVMREKAERERIRRKLLLAKQRHEDEEQQKVERQSALQRQRQIEEEVRQDLGIPRMLGTRTRMISSAAGVFLLGLISGWLVSHLISPGEQALVGSSRSLPSGAVTKEAAANSEGAMEPSGGAEAVAPGEQLAVMLDTSTRKDMAVREPNQQSQPVEGRTVEHSTTPFGERVPAGAADRPGDSSGRPRGQLAGKIGDTAAVAAPGAVLPRVSRNIEPGAAALPALGVLAREYAEAGAGAIASALLAEMRERVAGVTERPLQTRLLGRAAVLHRQAGDAGHAKQLLEQGMQQITQLPAGAARALASSALAVAAGREGRAEQRDTLLRQANTDVMSIKEPNGRLAAVCEIAEDYAAAGRRGDALALLDRVVQAAAAAAVQDPAMKNVLLQQAALAHARVGDPNGALAAVARIVGADRQDAALLAMIEESAQSHNAVWIAELSSRLQSPRYAAVAFALLGEAEAFRLGAGAQSERSFAQAEVTAKLIGDPIEQALAVGRIAQAYGHAGQAADEKRAFDVAIREAQAMSPPDARARARALGAIVDQQAAILAIGAAESTVSLLAEPELKKKWEDRIDDARRIERILRSGPVHAPAGG